ncbi:zinc finger protein 569-like [Diabrotica virgifera virgifera]|uniref:Zinc finger protein 569-like n=1 Tax=Diabrotica virgifera virgifera TaxID=50390 RepID=A0A6P7GIB8_DIAVI|nr:zinc finger protein 569-like [Diabrotica virgifera virgifera]
MKLGQETIIINLLSDDECCTNDESVLKTPVNTDKTLYEGDIELIQKGNKTSILDSDMNSECVEISGLEAQKLYVEFQSIGPLIEDEFFSESPIKITSNDEQEFSNIQIQNSNGQEVLNTKWKLIKKKRKKTICLVCNKSFPTTKERNEHFNKHCVNKIIICRFCSKTYVSKDEYLVHYSLHIVKKKSAAKNNGKNFITTKTIDVSNTEKHGKEIFKCNVCTAEFANLLQMQIHQKNHGAKRPFKCEFCCRTFVHFKKFKKHSCNSKSSKDTNYLINDSSHIIKKKKKSTRRSKYLIIHESSHIQKKKKKYHKVTGQHADISKIIDELISEDNGREIFKCNICDKKFVSMVQVQFHQKLHGIMRPYRCHVCCKAYGHVKNLEKHNCYFKTFKCRRCFSVFSQKTVYNKHVGHHNTNSLFNCDKCCHSFESKQNLTRHHKGNCHPDKLFKCKTCNISFTSKKTFDSHTALGFTGIYLSNM